MATSLGTLSPQETLQVFNSNELPIANTQEGKMPSQAVRVHAEHMRRFGDGNHDWFIARQGI
jgi:hypothetical protein